MVKINNKEMNWRKGMTVEDAIEFMGYPEYNYPILVVTLNGVHIKNDAFKTTHIDDGDVLKIMQPLDGG